MFDINPKLLEALDEYDVKSKLLQQANIQKIPFQGNLRAAVDCDLMYNVPIYDTAHRRYAAFSSLPEAIWHGPLDPKGNGVHFMDVEIDDIFDQLFLLYTFRLCGSGINYIPKKDTFHNTHGFGNFWIVDSLLEGKHDHYHWLDDLKKIDRPFSNNKGYLLPQFSIGLKTYIIEHAPKLVQKLLDWILAKTYPVEIYQLTDKGNELLGAAGFKRQNFVLTAFAADVAEYFPKLVDPHSRVYAGTNATKCIKSMFTNVTRQKDFDFINSVLAFLSDRYDLTPIDCEDSRACDPVRYFLEYQSKDHIEANLGMVYENNTCIKKTMSEREYFDFINVLKK